MKIKNFYIIFFFLTGNLSGLKAQICNPLTQSVMIPDSQVTMIQFIIEGVFPEELADPEQCLNAIRLGFEHSQIGDLTIRLVSPAGQIVTLTGPYTNSTNTTFADWNITFTACDNPSAPDPGFPDIWSNNAPWAILGNYTGVYYPFAGCLEDFNIGSVNGTWTLIIEDHLEFDQGMLHSIQLFFCNSESIDCHICEVNAGNFESDTLSYCQKSPELYFNQLQEMVKGEYIAEDYNFVFVVTKKDSIVLTDTLPDMRFFEPDTFRICAISYYRNDSILLDTILNSTHPSDFLSLFTLPVPQFCADISDTCLTVIVLPSPKIESITSTEIDCYQPKSIISAQYTGEPMILEWELPDGYLVYGDMLQSDQPGAHYLRVWNDYGCTMDTTFTVFADLEGPEFILPDTFPLSCTNPFITLPVIFLEPFDSVHWTGPNGFFSENPQPQTDQTGTYEVIIWGTNGCSSLDSVEIEEASELTDFSIRTDTLSCFRNPGTIRIDFSGAYIVEWSNLQTGSTGFGSVINFTAADSFLVIIRDQSSDCRAERIITGVVDTIPPVIHFLPSDTLTCYNRLVELRFDNPDQYIDFEWYGNGVTSQDAEIQVENAGWYYLEAQGENGCSAIDSIQVMENLEYDFDDVQIFLTCLQDSVALFVPFLIADTYLWLKDGIYFSNKIHPYVSEGGNYALIAGTLTGCVDTILVEVIEDRLIPDILLSVNGELNCNNNSVVIHAAVQSSIQQGSYWSGPNEFINSNDENEISQPGFYTFHATGTNGCIYADSIEVRASFQYPEINAFGDSLFCNEPVRPLMIYAEVNGITDQLFWTGPNSYISTSLSNTVVDSGMYVLTVVGQNGCVSMDTAWVLIDTLLPQIILSPIDTINCYNNGITLTIQSNQPLAEIRWSGPLNFSSGQNSIFTDQPGYYEVFINTPSGCFNEERFFVPVNKLKPYLSVSAEAITCRNPVTTLNHLTNIPHFSLQWTGPDNYQADGIYPVTGETGWHYAFITDLTNGCVNKDSILVVSNTAVPVITKKDFNLPCSDDPVEIFVGSTPSNVLVSWTGPGNFSYYGPVAPVTLPGYYQVTVEGADNGCIAIDSVWVDDEPVYPEFEIIHGHINCRDNTAKTIFIAGSEIDSVLWTGPNGFSSGQFEPDLLLPGFYQVFAYGSNACIKDTTVHVLQDTLSPGISIVYDDFLTCEKNTAILNASGSDSGSHISYLWTTEDGVLLSGNYSQWPKILGPGWYYLTLLNTKNHCISKDSVFVEEKESLLQSMVLEITRPTCFGRADGRIEVIDVFEGYEPVRYALDNQYFSPIHYFDNLKAGTYSVRIKDAYGCTLDSTVVVEHGSGIQIIIQADKEIIHQGETVQLTATIISDQPIDNIKWKPEPFFTDDQLLVQYVQPSETTRFSLDVQDENGCTASAEITVFVRDKPEIHIPNIFTPNGDNINDRFYIQGKDGVERIKRMEVYDRWGGRVFYAENILLNDYSAGWDGSFNGQKVLPGVYAYHLEVLTRNNKIVHFTGDITVIW